jgi:hypothetical protein
MQPTDPGRSGHPGHPAVEHQRRDQLHHHQHEHRGGQLGPDEVAVLHCSIPVLVDRVRLQLASRSGGAGREVVLDLSAVPPMPTAAPLLFLIRLLRRLTGPGGRIDVTGVTRLTAALVTHDLPDNLTLVKTRGRRWPA